jgi:hypothetical protein
MSPGISATYKTSIYHIKQYRLVKNRAIQNYTSYYGKRFAHNMYQTTIHHRLLNSAIAQDGIKRQFTAEGILTVKSRAESPRVYGRSADEAQEQQAHDFIAIKAIPKEHQHFSVLSSMQRTLLGDLNLTSSEGCLLHVAHTEVGEPLGIFLF